MKEKVKPVEHSKEYFIHDKPLIFSRSFWEHPTTIEIGYHFTKEELDYAEASNDGYIGAYGTNKCYLK